MAKKHEFRPDKVRFSILSHLILTQRQKRRLLKWILYAAMLLLLSVVQDVLLSRVRVQGATTELVPCAIFLICVIEGTQSGSIFSLVASLLYHFSVNDLGVYAVLFITFLAIIVTAFRQGYLRKGFAATMLCTVAALLVYELLLFVIALFLQKTLPNRVVGFLITAGMTMLVAPLIYLPAKAINSIGDNAWKE